MVASTKQLAQHEIDALLSGLAEGRGEDAQRLNPQRVKRYDFRRPDKFSKDHLRVIQLVFDTFGRLAGSVLSSLLRGQVQVRLTSVEQISYDEYIQQLPNPTAICLFSADPLPDRSILELNLPVLYAIIDRLLGGTGKRPQLQVFREATEIEHALARSAIVHMLRSYQEAWGNVVAMTPRLEDLVFNTSFIPSGVPGVVAAMAVLEMNIMGVTGTISTAIPYTVLEPVMANLNSQMWLAGPRRASRSEMKQPSQRLRDVALPVAGILGEAEVSLRDFLKLQSGNVIRLDTSPGQEIKVTAGGAAKYAALPGRVGNRLALQITKVVKDND